MRQLRIIEHVSLDGVIQTTADGNDFPYNDWTATYRTAVGLEMVTAAYGENFNLILGRRTYDMWSGFWPQAPQSPMADRLNAATKHVATHRPESLTWGPFDCLGSDIIDAVGNLRSQDGPCLILAGSSSLTSPLLEHGLVDELLLIGYPVLLGTGKRLFAEGTPARFFDFAGATTTPTGVTLTTYKTRTPALS